MCRIQLSTCVYMLIRHPKSNVSKKIKKKNQKKNQEEEEEEADTQV